ncbi:MAG: hypothetical protein GF341_03385 [candidate division Zixibacteria bacterium]|nr:hypothetical protein [candidate division Zixibacteria bacterium]
MRTVLFAHVFATLSMVGVIWFVQLVHYPMFATVDRAGFIEYHAVHMRRTSWVVVPLMFVEAISAGLLIWWTPPAISSLTLWIAAILLALIWISTFAVQVPLHNRLSRDGDPGTVKLLVATNWVRTVLWTARGLLVGWMVVHVLS